MSFITYRYYWLRPRHLLLLTFDRKRSVSDDESTKSKTDSINVTGKLLVLAKHHSLHYYLKYPIFSSHYNRIRSYFLLYMLQVVGRLLSGGLFISLDWCQCETCAKYSLIGRKRCCLEETSPLFTESPPLLIVLKKGEKNEDYSRKRKEKVSDKKLVCISFYNKTNLKLLIMLALLESAKIKGGY